MHFQKVAIQQQVRYKILAVMFLCNMNKQRNFFFAEADDVEEEDPLTTGANELERALQAEAQEDEIHIQTRHAQVSLYACFELTRSA